MRYNRGMGSALVRWVRRHATTITLFRAAALAPGQRFVRPESGPQPVTGVVQATLVSASASLPIGRVIGTPLIERAAGPALGYPTQQAPIPPTPPVPVPFARPPSFASPKISSDDDWRRLQTIFRKHQEKQTAQEQAVEGSTAPTEGPPVLSPTEPPSLQREPAPPQRREPEPGPREPQPDERRRARVEYVSPPAGDVTPPPAPREPQAITAPDTPAVQAQAEPPPRPTETIQQEVARPVRAEAEPQPIPPAAPEARVSREASTVIAPIQVSPEVAPLPQQPAKSPEPDRPGAVPEPAPTVRSPKPEPVEQIPPEAPPDRRAAQRAADLTAERAEAPTVIRKAPTPQPSRTPPAAPPAPAPAEKAPPAREEPPTPTASFLEEAAPDTAIVEEISPGDDTIALPYAGVQEQIPVPGFLTQPRPLEAAWPVQRREEPTLAFVPSAVSLAAAEMQPSRAVDEQEIHRFLGDVVSAQPTDSSIEVITPRRPRPVLPPTAAPGTPVPPAGASPSPPAVQMRRETEPAGIQTEIGPLPADLWQLLDQPPPGQPPVGAERPHPVPQAAAAVSTAKAQPISQASPPRPAGPALVSPIVQREAAPPTPASEPEAGGAETRGEETTPTEEVDTDELARQVYAVIKRRLAVEWERVRQRF